MELLQIVVNMREMWTCREEERERELFEYAKIEFNIMYVREFRSCYFEVCSAHIVMRFSFNFTDINMTATV